MKDIIYELLIEDESDEIYAISLVSEPAIELDFVYFDKEEVKFSTVNEEERIVMGPILVPNKKILRIDGEGKPYYVFLREDTIKKLAQKYLKNKYQSEVTIEHNGKRVDDVTLVESWITESRTKDKSAVYNISVPVGTWMGAMKIGSDKIWNDYVKTGKVNGFSIEGLFSHSLVEASKEDFWTKDIQLLSEDEAEVVLKKIRAVISEDKRYKSKKRIDMESFSDYGEGIRNNAKKGIELNERNGNKCATQTGKVRAQQIAKGEPLSLDTIKRMYSYLSRAEVYYDQAESTSDCGHISYLLWGGKAALSYSRNKLRELGLLQENEAQPSFPTPPSYAGEPASASVAPATLGDVPPIFQDFEVGNIDVFGVETENFHICPGAVELFTHLVQMPIDEDTKGMIRSAALQADRLFDIEEDVVEDGIATPRDVGEAITLVADFKDLMKEIDEITGMQHDVSFMDGHIKIIKQYL